MPLPRWLARANNAGLNRVTSKIVPRLPFLAVVHPGRRYETPVTVFRSPAGFIIISLAYGPRHTDWVRLEKVRAAVADVTQSCERVQEQLDSMARLRENLERQAGDVRESRREDLAQEGLSRAEALQPPSLNKLRTGCFTQS